MEVMLNDGVRLVPVAAWGVSGMEVNPGLASGSSRLVLMAGGHAPMVVPAFAALVQPMMPWAGQFLGEGGEVVEVQSFRYQTTDGEVRFLMWCASCGRVQRAGQVEVGEVGKGQCPGCGMVRSGRGCLRMHNWGLCPECREPNGHSIAAAARGECRCGCASSAEIPAAPKGGALGELAGSAGAELDRGAASA